MGLGLHSAIHIAHMGMGAAEKSINVSGNNLANANTYGYKSERPDFTSFLSYTYNYGSSPGQIYTAGTNPRQIGMGVELSSVTTNFTQGAFKEGMTASDVAINGTGFMIVQNAGSSTPYYTRNGALKVNNNFDLVTNSGMYVMGYSIDDKFRIQTDALRSIKIPIGEMHIAEQTNNINISGILDAVGDSGTQGTVLATRQMTDLSANSPNDQKLSASQIPHPVVEGVTQAAGSGAPDGQVEEGEYLYRFAFVDAQGVESDYSGIVTAEVGPGQNAVELTDLPEIPNGYAQLRIYRAKDPGVNDPGSAVFYRVDEITSPATSYTDLSAQSAIEAGNQTLDLGRLQIGTYNYYVTYTDAYGNETRPSLISDPVNLNIPGQVELTDIPVDDTGTWTGRNIYRCTANDPSNFYLVTSIPNMDPDVSVIDRTSDAELTTDPIEISVAGRGSVLINDSTRLLDVGKYENGNFVNAFQLGTLKFTPAKGENNLKHSTLEITETTTVADYLNFLNESFGIRNSKDDPSIPPDQGELGSLIKNGTQGAHVVEGSLYLVGNAGVANTLELDSGDMRFIAPTKPGEKATETPFSLEWLETSQKAVGAGVSTDLEVYDSLGTPISIQMTMVLESKTDTETVYRWYADSGDNQPEDGTAIATGTGTIRFDSKGRLISASNTTISVERTSVASESPLNFDFNMNVDALMALATNSPTLMQTYQDGAAAGTLHDYEIQSDGTIMGIFTGGAERPLGQILLATFTNEGGLYKSGDSLYRQSTNSGQAKIIVPGTDGMGVIKGRSLELSNTDVGQEIVDMILASSMYRANAKVMTTSNEMYDALLRII